LLPLLLADVVYAVLFVVFYGGAAVPALFLLAWAHERGGLLALALGLPVAYLAFLLALVLLVGGVRLILPTLRPGRYALPVSRGVAVWLLHLTLQRYVNNGLVKDTLYYLNGLRTLYFRLMGARVHPTANVSGNVNLMDLGLLEVGRGSLIGSGVAIFGHYMSKGQLVLARNVIGERVVVGAYTLIAPGLTVGDRAFLGIGCGIGTQVTIGAGARLEAGSRVWPGTVIPPGEAWAGSPATKVDRPPPSGAPARDAVGAEGAPSDPPPI
jgi:carbonic anhydrase/acetyltransferase-like protein (isoleucine patch superfamily)